MKHFTKKLLSVVLSLLIVLSVMPTAIASASENPWKFTKTEVAPGEEFTMTMEMPETVLASTLGFKITFDKTVFEILEIPTTPWTDMQPNMAGCNNAGNIMISWCDPTYDANTTIDAGTVLLTVTFKAKDDAVLGDSDFFVEDWNVGGAFSDETFMPEVITPMPEIMGSTTTIKVAAAAAEAAVPEITENPESVEIFDGEDALLDVIATTTDGGDLSYQWYKDGEAIEGAIDAMYTATEAGTYYVVVTNTLGETTASATSTEAVVTVIAVPNAPVVAPIDDVTIMEGETATLEASAEANGVLSYAWYFGEELISDTASVTVSEAGIYRVVVTNELNGYTVSEEVTVTVTVEENPEIKEDADANNVLLGKEYTHNVATWHTSYTAADAGFLTDGLRAESWYDKTESEYFAAKSQAVVEITFDMWYAREIKELNIEFIEDTGAGISRPYDLAVYAINGEEETLIYDAKIPALDLTLVADAPITAEKIKLVTNGSTYTFLDEVEAYVEATGNEGYTMGEGCVATNLVEGMTYTIEGVSKWYNTNTDDSAATKLTNGVISWGTSYNSVNNFGANSSTAPVITFNFDEVKDIAEIDIYAIFGRDGIGAPDAVIEYKDADGNWVKVADIIDLLHQNFIVAEEEIKATALRFTFNTGFCFLGEIQVYDKVTNMAATGKLLSNENYLLGETYTSDVTSWYKDAANDSASTYLTDGVKGGDFYGSAYFGAKQGSAEVIFALDEATKLSEIYMQFLAGQAGITIPATTIYVQASDDAEWVKIYDGTPAENNFRAGTAEGFTAKNIKLNFVGGPFIFVKEVEAYKELTGNATNGTLAVVPDAVAPTVVIGDGAEEITIADGYLSLVAQAATTDEGTLSYQWYKDDVAVGTNSFYTMWGGASAGTYKVVVTNTLGSSTATAEASVVVKFDDTKANIALGKSYEWVTGMWSAYPDTDLKELTDGVLDTWKYYTNAAYAGASSPEIILDLGKEVEIFRVATAFMSSGNAGLTLPSYAKYQYSTDKETWYDFGSEWTNGNTAAADLIVTGANVAEPVTARYVKLNAESSWIFLGEFMVYGDKPAEAVAPVIDTDLEIAKSIFEGEEAVLTVAASTADEGTLSYQWYKDGVAIDGATEATLTVTEAGLYKVVVTNTLGESTATAESAVCAVTVLAKAEAPVITAEPEDAEIFEGETATLAVVAEADGELSYQWYKDGVAIEGATEATYETSEAGEYYAVVTNTLNGTTATTETVKVTVTVKVINYVAEANGVKYETLAEAIAAGGEVVLLDNIVIEDEIVVEGTVVLDLAGFKVSKVKDGEISAYDQLIVNKGDLTIEDSIGGGELSYQYVGPTVSTGFAVTTITNRDGATLTVNGGTIDNCTTTGMTAYAIDSIIYGATTTLNINGGTVKSVKGEGRGLAIRACVNGDGNGNNVVNITGGTITGGFAGLQIFNISTKDNPADVNISGGTFNGTYAVYTSFMGTDSKSVDIEITDGEFNGYVYLYNGNPGSAANPFTASIEGGTFNGGVWVYTADENDEDVYLPVISGGTFFEDVSYNCVDGFMTTDEDGDGVFGVVEAPSVPVITAEPEDATILEGETATLAVEASANGELSYQWYKDGVAIEGATEATYETSEAGEYYAVVTNTLNGETATTETVKVTVTVEIPVVEFVAPELVFDAETRVLTAVKNSVDTVKVGVAYIGDATFEVGVDNWNEFVELGKAEPSNGAAGYVVYADFTERSFKTVGNYVAFAKYTNDEGATVSDYYVFTIVAAEEIVAPYFTVEGNALTLVNEAAATIVNVGAAYVGDTAFDAENATWESFVAAGQAQPDYNGTTGYATYGADFTTKTFQKSGNYAVYVKYLDTYGNTQMAYYGFEIESGETVYELTWVPETRKFTMITEAEDFQYRMGVAYIGDDTFDFENPDWDTFVALGKKNPAMNSSMGYVLYVNACPTKEYKTPGNYAAFVKYIDAYGNTVVDYYEFNIPKFSAPELDFTDNTLSLVMNAGQPPVKVGVAYIGDATFDAEAANWNDFVAKGQAQSAMNGSAGYVTYSFNESGAVRTYRTMGNYVAFVKYTNTITGSVKSDYMTFTVA